MAGEVGEHCDTGKHWDAVFDATPAEAVSWYEPSPETSIRLLSGVMATADPIVVVGVGVSALPDALLAAGRSDITVLDVSAVAVEALRRRLGDTAATVSFVVADVCTWDPPRRYAAWHDRAVFHFLVDVHDREAYVEVASRAVRPGGALVLATFAEDGPTACSGLPTARYRADELEALFGRSFALTHTEREEHTTPAGVVQPFTWVVLRRHRDPEDEPSYEPG